MISSQKQVQENPVRVAQDRANNAATVRNVVTLVGSFATVAAVYAHDEYGVSRGVTATAGLLNLFCIVAGILFEQTRTREFYDALRESSRASARDERSQDVEPSCP